MTARGLMKKTKNVRVLRRRRSKKMTQSNTPFPQESEVPLDFQRSDGS